MHSASRSHKSGNLRVLATIIALTIALSSHLSAQQVGVGPMVLRLPASARMLGMANAGLTGNDGDALFYNPVLLANARGVALSLQSYGSNATAGSMGSVYQGGANTIGIGVQYVSWTTNATSYASALHDGGSHLSDSGAIAASSTAISFGLSRTFRGRRFGVSAKYVEDRFANVHDGTIAFDAGVMLPSWGPGSMSFVAQNIGEGLRLNGEKGQLPTRIGIGYGGGMYQAFEKFDFGLQTQLTVDRGGFVRPAGGAELGYVPIEGVSFIVRAGLRLPKEKDEPLATGGLGVTIDRFSLDYAMEPMRGGRPVSHRLGIRVR
ncbi:MAG: hypothetical protein ABJB66_19190 [Gemmatimonadaceae bacterium]